MLTTCYLRVDLFVLRCQELFSALLFVLMPGLPWSFSPCLLLSPCSLDLGRLYSWLVTFCFLPRWGLLTASIGVGVLYSIFWRVQISCLCLSKRFWRLMASIMASSLCALWVPEPVFDGCGGFHRPGDLNVTNLPWPFRPGLWEGLRVRSNAWGLNLACSMALLS